MSSSPHQGGFVREDELFLCTPSVIHPMSTNSNQLAPSCISVDGGSPPWVYNIEDLIIPGFSSSYRKSKGEGSKNLIDFSHGWLQPSGVWYSHSQKCSSEIIESAFSEAFPLSKSEPLPPWVSGPIEFIRNRSVSELRQHLFKRRTEFRSAASFVRGNPSPEFVRWRESQPKGVYSVTRNFNPQLFKAVADHAGVSAAGLLGLFRDGFPVLGSFSAPGVFPKVSSGEPEPLSKLLGRCERLWADVPSFEKGLSPSERDELWSVCIAEAKNGWLADPIPIDCIDQTRAIPVRRFALAQGDKTRFCDNFKRSCTNRCASTDTPIKLPSADTLAEIATRLSRPDGGQVALWKSDHEAAYKQLPVNPLHSEFCWVVAKGPDGRWYGFRPKTLLFGSSHAVLS